MKKHLLTLTLLIASASGMFSQSIPNGGFENWNTTTYENPMYWYTSNNESSGNILNVTKVNDPYHASYALHLATVPNGPNIELAYIANGNPTNPAGQGIPYNEQASGLRFHYKCNILPNDSALVWVIFKKSGAVIGNYVTKITGTQTTYTVQNVAFSLSQAPDSIIFAATSSDPFNYTGPAGSTFQLDSVNFTGVSSQPINFNGSFEQWQMVTSTTPLGWTVNSSSSSSQTTDNYSGNYAIRLMTTSGGTVGYPGNATNGISTPSTTLGGNPFSNQIDTLVFYYKYSPVNSNDSAMVSLNFKKNFVYFQVLNKLLPAAGSYTQAKMPINLSMAPDTLVMFLNSSKNWSVPATYAGAEFKVDNMYLTSQVIPVSDFTTTSVACSGQTLQLTDNSSNLPTAYTWTMTGATPSVSSSQNPVVSYTSPGTYTVVHSTSNSFGNGTVVTKTISVNTTPTVGVTGFNNLCIGSSVILTANGASTYVWAAGPTTPTIAVSPTVTTSYSVTGTTAGCMNTANMTVTVNPLPTITAVSNSSLICTGQSATLTANGGTSYTWTPGGPGSTIVVSPTVTSTYTINGTDANGCNNVSSFTQSVSACTSVNELAGGDSGLIVYPNPNNGSFTIKSTTEDVISLINELGQTVKTIELNEGNNYTSSLSDMPAGIYFANGLNTKFKVVVIK